MPDLQQVLEHLSAQLERLDAGTGRSGDRFVGSHASESYVERIASGGSARLVPRHDARAPGLAGLMSKALAEGTGSSGGYLVPVELAAEILLALRARSAVMRMGPRIVPVAKELDLAALSTGASAYYVAENAAIPVSEQTFAETPLLRPRDLAALVPVSNRLLRDASSNPSVEEIVRSDLAEVLALRADLAFLRGTGASSEPVGIRNTAGLTPAPSLGVNGATPTFDDLKDMVANLRAVNAPFLKPGWVFHPRTINTLEKFTDSTGRYLADSGLLTFDATGGGGTLLNFPFVTTTQIPVNVTTGASSDTSEIHFSSDWQEAWVGENDQLRIEVSTEAAYDTGSGLVSSFQLRQTLFRATWGNDFALRRPVLFTVMTGVRP